MAWLPVIAPSAATWDSPCNNFQSASAPWRAGVPSTTLRAGPPAVERASRPLISNRIELIVQNHRFTSPARLAKRVRRSQISPRIRHQLFQLFVEQTRNEFRRVHHDLSIV